MIRSFLIASVVLVHSAICYAQSMLPVQQDTTLFLHSNEVIFSGVADYQSTSVGKDITKSLIGLFMTLSMRRNTEVFHKNLLLITPSLIPPSLL